MTSYKAPGTGGGPALRELPRQLGAAAVLSDAAVSQEKAAEGRRLQRLVSSAEQNWAFSCRFAAR